MATETSLLAILIPVAMLAIFIGWIALIVNARRASQLRFKGLGIEISINSASRGDE